MKITSYATIALFSTLLIACGGGDGDDGPESAIPEPHLKALEKARDTEKVLQEAEERRRKEMEERGI